MAETPQGHRDAGQVRADAERELNEQLDETREERPSERAMRETDEQERGLETEQERKAREERERVAGQPV